MSNCFETFKDDLIKLEVQRIADKKSIDEFYTDEQTYLISMFAIVDAIEELASFFDRRLCKEE